MKHRHVLVRKTLAGAALDVRVHLQQLLHALVLSLVSADREHKAIRVQLALHLSGLR